MVLALDRSIGSKCSQRIVGMASATRTYSTASTLGYRNGSGGSDRGADRSAARPGQQAASCTRSNATVVPDDTRWRIRQRRPQMQVPQQCGVCTTDSAMRHSRSKEVVPDRQWRCGSFSGPLSKRWAVWLIPTDQALWASHLYRINVASTSISTSARASFGIDATKSAAKILWRFAIRL
jgi:hypothetical protein